MTSSFEFASNHSPKIETDVGITGKIRGRAIKHNIETDHMIVHALSYMRLQIQQKEEQSLKFILFLQRKVNTK